MSPELWGRSGRSSRRRPRKHTNLALIYTDYSAPSDRGPRKSRADRALAVDALRRGGEPARDGESMLLPPVDREGMRRKASSAAVECELRLRCGRCRKLCIVDRWRAKARREA